MNLQILLSWLHGLFSRHDLLTAEVEGAFGTLENATKSLFGKLGHALHITVNAGTVTHTPVSIPSPGHGAEMVGAPVTEHPEGEVTAADPSDKQPEAPSNVVQSDFGTPTHP